METNYITFNNENFDQAKGEGLISTLTQDIKITAEPFQSDNPKAPTHRLFGFSPAGHRLEVGGIWKKKNAEGGDYYTLSIKTIGFNANLGKAPYQDDTKNQAIIAWQERTANAA